MNPSSVLFIASVDKSLRVYSVEIAHALLASVDTHDELSDVDREKLHAAIHRSIEQIEAGQTVPFDDVLASLRAKRVSRATR